MEALEWFPCNESLDDLLKNPKVQLPQMFKFAEDFVSLNGGEKLKKDQVFIIHSTENLSSLIAENEKGNQIRLLVNCPYKIKQRLAPGKEKNFDSIMDLAKSEPLPKFVEVTSVLHNDRVSKGDRLKVVIVEKSGSNPSFIHFRSANGKHIKLAVDQKVSFTLAANVTSEQTLDRLAEKSRELPIVAEFIKQKDMPDYFNKIGPITITKPSKEKVVIASANVSKNEYAVVFPLNMNFKFQVNSKLKLEKDEAYRELCQSMSNKVETNKIMEHLSIINPEDSIIKYVFKYENIMKSTGDYEESKSDRSNTEHAKEQRDLIKKQQKEQEKQAKEEKEKLKAEKKRERKEKKEKEKEGKKKKKTLSRSDTNLSECVDEDMYVVPHSPIAPPPASTSEADETQDSDNYQQPQWALHLMKKMKKVRDRTKSVGKTKHKKRGKLTKDDIQFDSSSNLNDQEQSNYIGLGDEAFSESLYETLPCDSMAYESLDLIKEAQRSLSTKQELSNPDSGFDEIDQAKIQEWRDQMIPPPLPGNHPHQNRLNANNNADELYEVAIDNTPGGASWNNFFGIVEQSAKEISSWDMEDVTNCLDDLMLGKYRSIFADSQIDGQLLLDLDESVLLDLGLTPFEARKLRKFTFGWRPDIMRPENYPKLEGFENPDPSQWSKNDVIAHLKVIGMQDFAKFCEENQVNGDLLKDICIDDKIMNLIILTRDKKLKTVKIKNYVIDQWRPKKKGEGNYVKVSELTKPHSSNQGSLGSPKFRSSPGPATVHGNDSNRAGGDAPLIARMKQQLSEKSK